MGIIEDVKADLLNGIRLAERLVEAIAGAPAAGGIESDDVAGCPFEDDGVPDARSGGDTETKPPTVVVAVETFTADGPTHTQTTFTADSWVSHEGELHLYRSDQSVAVFPRGRWTAAWFPGEKA
jgi:hypothetical protein